MRAKFERIDSFNRNILIVFAGNSLVNFFNLVYQLLIAHNLTAANFAAFNSLLSIFMMISTPLSTLQLALAKYCAGCSAQGLGSKVRSLCSGLLKKAVLLAAATFGLFWLLSGQLMLSLKIPSLSAGYILAALLALSWVAPLFSGVAQGLELFGWSSGASLAGAALKLALSVIFIKLGFNIAGALGALGISSFVSMFILYLPLKKYIGLKASSQEAEYKPVLSFLLPVAISNFSFIALASMDMVLVKHFFSEDSAGVYALAQMVGKIFLFFPGAISMVMFPRASGLNARNLDTGVVLRRSLFYAAALCLTAVVVYNSAPSFVLRMLTGKAPAESVALGRLFSISMSFFALSFILVTYFLSINDLRFVKYLFGLGVLQCGAIMSWHASLAQVQVILSVNALLLFLIYLMLAFKRPDARP